MSAGGKHEQANLCARFSKALFVQNLLDAGFLSKKEDQRALSGFGKGERPEILNDIIMANSQHAHRVELINAMLVAGLYPNFAAMRCYTRRPPDCFTNEDGKVSIHPSSLLASCFGDKRLCAPPSFLSAPLLRLKVMAASDLS
jgi:hypothetical protein